MTKHKHKDIPHQSKTQHQNTHTKQHTEATQRLVAFN